MFVIHIVGPIIAVVGVALHLAILHMWSSSCCTMDRILCLLSVASLLSYVLYRDVALLLGILYGVSSLVLLFWAVVFHEESFEVLNIGVTASKILPEWFFMWLFGVIKSVASRLCGIALLVFIIAVLSIVGVASISWYVSLRSLYSEISYGSTLVVFVIALSYYSGYVSLVFPDIVALGVIIMVHLLIITV